MRLTTAPMSRPMWSMPTRPRPTCTATIATDCDIRIWAMAAKSFVRIAQFVSALTAPPASWPKDTRTSAPPMAVPPSAPRILPWNRTSTTKATIVTPTLATIESASASAAA